jgi:hypothetical protein
MDRKGGFSVKKAPLQCKHTICENLLTINVEFSRGAESLASQILRHTGVVSRVL